jgi:hypothetical protein
MRHKRVRWSSRAKRVEAALLGASGAQTLEDALHVRQELGDVISQLQEDRDNSSRPAHARVASALERLGAAVVQMDARRMSMREFVGVTAEELVETLSGKDAFDIFSRKYQGRYVRWRVQYCGKDGEGGFVANAGTSVEMACTPDPSVPAWKLEQLQRWQVVIVEGRLHGPGRDAQDRHRAKVVFDCCLVA